MEQYKIEHLNFSYPLCSHKALDDVTLNIEHGKFIVICGKSGCGKTTLLRQLKSVLAPKGELSGTIMLDGKQLNEVSLAEQAEKVGFVMQDPDSQLVTDKVWHELAFGLENLGFDTDKIRLRVAETASYFDIGEWFLKNVSELSGGQKQILNLAAVMAMYPHVLILDEPTSQLDPIAAEHFINTLDKINKELGVTIIITEHRLEEVFSHADRILIMESGKISHDITSDEFRSNLYDLPEFVKNSMPTAMQIFIKSHSKGISPVTVRDARKWLADKDILNAPEYTETEFSKNNAVEIKDVYFRYSKNGDDVLRDLSLKVPCNSVFAVLGSNGAGKTTLLSVMSGTRKAYSGKVTINSKSIEKYKSDELYKNNIAVMPQNVSALFTHNTVRQELGEKSSQTDEIISLTNIGNLLDSHPFDISGGEQQRVALAKLMLKKPKILMLDEPTKGMDGEFKLIFSQILKNLKAYGCTVILISHDIEFCAKNADLCAMLFDSQIAASTDTRTFFADNHFYTTAAKRISSGIIDGAMTDEDVVKCLKK